MPRDFTILTEDFCDLPESYCTKHHLVVLPTEFSVDDQHYTNDINAANYLAPKDFYGKLRAQGNPKTVALSIVSIQEAMKNILNQGKDVLYIAFSSGLSSTCSNGMLAAQELREQYSDAKILAVDSLSASLGQGLLVHYALEQQAKGKTIEEVASYIEENRQKFCHYFTVDDLHFLHRGGRVSKTSAVVGSMLGIKPILHVNEEGKLIPIGKVRGRRQSLDTLVKKMGEKIGNNDNPVVFISHGDCEEDANYVRDLVKKKFGIHSFIINYVGSTIGAHSGPGTLALFFIGDNRTEK